MDCSATENGWFDFKGIVSQPGSPAEVDLNQDVCIGSVGGSPPFNTVNHHARCGYINTYVWDSNQCQIDDM